MNEHPLGDVEVRLAGDRVQPLAVLKIRFCGEVSASQLAEVRAGDPREVSQHEDRLGKRGDEARPICGKKVGLKELDRRPVGTASQAGAGVFDIGFVDFRRDRLVGLLELVESGEQEVANPARRLNDRRRPESLASQQGADRLRQPAWGLKVAVLGRFLALRHRQSPTYLSL